MYKAHTVTGIHRGASRRKKRLHRALKRLRNALLAVLLVGLMLVCAWFGADVLHEVLLAAHGMASRTAGMGDLGTQGSAGAVGAVHLAVNPQLQNPELKNGCEATSLAMVLHYLGYDIDKIELAYGFIPREDFKEVEGTLFAPRPAAAYVGDPATSRGFYCYAAPVAAGGNAVLAEVGGAGYFRDATGESLESLKTVLEGGYPVIIWATLYYESELQYMDTSWVLPDGDTYIPYSNLHCVVLTGYSEGWFTLCDPMMGEVKIDAESLAASYEVMGSRAVVYQP